MAAVSRPEKISASPAARASTGSAPGRAPEEREHQSPLPARVDRLDQNRPRREPREPAKLGVKRSDQGLRRRRRRMDRVRHPVPRLGSRGQHPCEPGHGLGGKKDLGGRHAQVQPEAKACFGQHGCERPPGHLGRRGGTLRELRKPVSPVERQHHGAVLEGKDPRHHAVSLRLGIQEHKELGIRQSLVEPEPQRVVLRRLRHCAMRPVEHGLRHLSTSATRARSAGTTRSPNHGFRLSQPVLRQDGCGRGNTSGA